MKDIIDNDDIPQVEEDDEEEEEFNTQREQEPWIDWNDLD